MKIENLIHQATKNALKELYNFVSDENQIQIQNTRKNQEGDNTLAVFSWIKY